jgi:hypothetical protein
MAGAGEGQSQPELMECLDLVRSAVWIWLRPSVPQSNRSVINAVKLLYFGAVVELMAAITIAATFGAVKASVAARNPDFSADAWHAIVTGQLDPLVVNSVLGVGFWLWIAWSIGRGHLWARAAFVLFFGLTTLSLLQGLTRGSAVYAQADLVMGVALWLVELASVALIFRVKPTAPPSDTNCITSEG